MILLIGKIDCIYTISYFSSIEEQINEEQINKSRKLSVLDFKDLCYENEDELLRLDESSTSK